MTTDDNIFKRNSVSRGTALGPSKIKLRTSRPQVSAFRFLSALAISSGMNESVCVRERVVGVEIDKPFVTAFN